MRACSRASFPIESCLFNNRLVAEQAPSRVNPIAAVGNVPFAKVLPGNSTYPPSNFAANAQYELTYPSGTYCGTKADDRRSFLPDIFRHVGAHLNEIIASLKLARSYRRADLRQSILPSKLIVPLEIRILEHFLGDSHSAFAALIVRIPDTILADPHR